MKTSRTLVLGTIVNGAPEKQICGWCRPSERSLRSDLEWAAVVWRRGGSSGKLHLFWLRRGPQRRASTAKSSICCVISLRVDLPSREPP
ncbi:hypothetical protein Q5P01_021599 [Channa striata]|uniref:Uncharacterized protein n=1 Tax=Channa striata TaxID=64152 RepID=A0AA88S9I0_CHASR|nr:hypothetical protein Q5P01_021599 [Channa striata]